MEVIVKDFIFCDDIRIEEGSKYSLMGIYADKLKLMPRAQNIKKFKLPISAFIRFQNLLDKKNQSYDFNISISFENSNLANIEGSINFGEEQYSTLPITRIEFQVEKSGPLNFHVRLKKKDNTVLDYAETLNIIVESVAPVAQS